MPDAPAGDVRLMLGDCLEKMGEIEDGSVDLIAADLPFGSTACAWDVVIPFEPLWGHYRRILKSRGAVVLNASQPFTSMLITSNREWFKYELIWNKSAPSNFQLANYQPLKVHENLVIFSPDPAVFTKHGNCMRFNPQRSPRDPANRRPYPKAGRKMMRIRSGVSTPGANWDPEMCFPTSILDFHAHAAECNSSKRMHNCQKPVALMEYLIRTYSDPGDLVLDSCMGSGTTGIACLNTGRRFIGIEKDDRIFATARARVAAHRASTPLFAEATP